jgi:hypothetical protein
MTDTFPPYCQSVAFPEYRVHNYPETNSRELGQNTKYYTFRYRVLRSKFVNCGLLSVLRGTNIHVFTVVSNEWGSIVTHRKSLQYLRDIRSQSIWSELQPAYEVTVISIQALSLKN